MLLLWLINAAYAVLNLTSSAKALTSSGVGGPLLWNSSMLLWTTVTLFTSDMDMFRAWLALSYAIWASLLAALAACPACWIRYLTSSALSCFVSRIVAASLACLTASLA